MPARSLQGEVQVDTRIWQKDTVVLSLGGGGLCVYLLVGILMLLFIYLHGESPKTMKITCDHTQL